MENNEAKAVGIGWGFLSFIIPIVGIVLFFAWKNDESKLKVADRTLIPAIVSIVIAAIRTMISIGSM